MTAVRRSIASCSRQWCWLCVPAVAVSLLVVDCCRGQDMAAFKSTTAIEPVTDRLSLLQQTPALHLPLCCTLSFTTYLRLNTLRSASVAAVVAVFQHCDEP